MSLKPVQGAVLTELHIQPDSFADGSVRSSPRSKADAAAPCHGYLAYTQVVACREREVPVISPRVPSSLPHFWAITAAGAPIVVPDIPHGPPRIAVLPGSQRGPAAVPRMFMLVQSPDKTWTWNLPATSPDPGPRYASLTSTLPYWRNDSVRASMAGGESWLSV